jgi:hypothetical protein
VAEAKRHLNTATALLSDVPQEVTIDAGARTIHGGPSMRMGRWRGGSALLPSTRRFM